MMKSYLRAIWEWLLTLFGQSTLYQLVLLDELPETPKPQKVYVIGDADTHWMAAMICPCGCGDLIQLATDPTGRPRWDVTKEKNGVATLHPSVHRKVRCKSHFFVKRGRIIWCND